MVKLKGHQYYSPFEKGLRGIYIKQEKYKEE